jgi:hypothetical protein
MAGGDQEFKQKKFDTTKTLAEDLRMCGMEDEAGRGGGSHGTAAGIHQHGGVGRSKTGRYPAVLAGVAVLTGIGTAMYYKSLERPGKANDALESLPIPKAGTGGAPAAAAAPRC